MNLLDGFGRLRRRYRLVAAVDTFLEIAFVLTAGVGALLLADRLAFEFGWSALHASRAGQVTTAFGIALAVAAIAAPVVAAVRRVPAAGLAWRADKVLAADERLLTSMDLEEGSAFTPVLRAEAEKALSRAEPRRVIPWRPVGYRWGIALALAAGALLAASPPPSYAPPIAELVVTPERGVAPLVVVCEDVSQGRITERRWEFGDGEKATFEPRVEHVYTKPGKYPIRLFIRGPGGSDAATHDAVVEVLDAKAPFADFAADPRKGRVPLDVKFRNLSKNADAFKWTFGDGVVSTERDPVHRYEKPGVFDVTMDAGTDRVTRKALIKVVGPDAPLADFRAWPRKGEAPLVVTFEDNSTGPITEWLWDFGDKYALDERFSRLRNPAHEYKFPGRYTVRLVVRGPGGDDTMVRKHYIEVSADGDGGGNGGSGTGSGPRPLPEGTAPNAGKTPGKLYGDPSARPEAEFKPESVPAQPKGSDLVEKVKDVFTGDKIPGETSAVKPYKEVFGEYRRAAEDAMNREQIPPGLRDYVKKYFEQIRPK